MARPVADALRATVLDRLLDPLDGEKRGPTISLRELKAAVARDLERLLNTKSALAHDPRVAVLPEARDSILTYGLPDFASASWRNPNDTRRICSEVAAAIKSFEPRLLPSTVRVSPIENADGTGTRIRIEATLHVDPITEPVYFDSSDQLGTGGVHIEEGS